jgi:hypothetical protein
MSKVVEEFQKDSKYSLGTLGSRDLQGSKHTSWLVEAVKKFKTQDSAR